MRQGTNIAKHGSVGEQSVKPPKPFLQRRAEAVNAVIIFNVHRHERAAPAVAFDTIVEIFKPALCARRCDNMRAGFGEA